MTRTTEPAKLNCECEAPDPWPPPRVDDAPKPAVPPEPPDHELATPRYDLPGPQIEPEAAFWTICGVPCAVSIEELVKRTDNPDDPCYFPPYPTQASVVRDEIDELIELAALRDDPEAVFSVAPRRERRGISPFLQLHPQPLGAVVNIHRDPVLGAVLDQRLPDRHAVDVARGKELDPAYPAVATGRELARYFEAETPGIAHRLALNYLLQRENWSPPRQAWAWAALDVAIYSALAAAWYYKWGAGVGLPGVPPRPGVSFRPRPWEMDHRVSVLYNREVNDAGSGDNGRRTIPAPSPGTPRHPAYPSGHATYAGAASELLSYFFPDYTEEFDRLADNIGMARLWGGIHWRSDCENGMALGRCVARIIIEQLEDSCICPVDNCTPPSNCAKPPADEELAKCRHSIEHCCEERPRHGHTPRSQGERETAGPALSDRDVAAQASSPQQGAAPIPGSSGTQERPGPQVGGAGGGADQRDEEAAKSPQEGGG